MTSRSAYAFTVLALLSAPVAGCGSHDYDDDRVGTADGGAAQRAPEGNRPPAGSSSGAAGRPTAPATSPAGSSTAPAAARCAPGAACNGVRHCYDGEFVVAGNGTCTVDCNCLDDRGGVSATGVGTLVCNIGSCR